MVKVVPPPEPVPEPPPPVLLPATVVLLLQPCKYTILAKQSVYRSIFFIIRQTIKRQFRYLTTIYAAICNILKQLMHFFS
jgi:hypothetical protein